MKKNQSGQALILIIFAIALAISILGGAVITAVSLGKNAREGQNSRLASNAAESGLEYALIFLVRNPTVCSGSQTFNINNVEVAVTYSFADPVCTVTSSAQVDTVIKRFQTEATISNQRVTYCCWKALP